MVRPILLQGQQRPLTQIKYNKEGDLLFSASKDQVASVWYSHNGERLGTYNGHQGALWTLDVNNASTLLVTGAADNTMKLWEVQTGKCLFTWEFPTLIKRVEFSEDNTKVLAVAEERMEQKGKIYVFAINNEVSSNQKEEPILVITTAGAKATVAAWSYLDKWIISGHSDGTITKYDAITGNVVETASPHESGHTVTDIQFSLDRTHFVTSSKDKTAILHDVLDLNSMKVYQSDRPLNTAVITPIKDFIIVGGGQDARDVTTTVAREGGFEARFFHKIFEDEIGRIKGHFGPIHSLAVHPDGTSYSSGSEDGFIRMHHFEKHYFDFKYEVERDNSVAQLESAVRATLSA